MLRYVNSKDWRQAVPGRLIIRLAGLLVVAAFLVACNGGGNGNGNGMPDPEPGPPGDEDQMNITGLDEYGSVAYGLSLGGGRRVARRGLRRGRLLAKSARSALAAASAAWRIARQSAPSAMASAWRRSMPVASSSRAVASGLKVVAVMACSPGVLALYHARAAGLLAWRAIRVMATRFELQ